MLKLASEHFRLDLQLFWQRSSLFLVLDTAVATVYASASQASLRPMRPRHRLVRAVHLVSHVRLPGQRGRGSTFNPTITRTDQLVMARVRNVTTSCDYHADDAESARPEDRFAGASRLTPDRLFGTSDRLRSLHASKVNSELGQASAQASTVRLGASGEAELQESRGFAR
jgi:hypothetical protein